MHKPRKELALDLALVCPQVECPVEEWERLFQNKAFLNLLSLWKAEMLRLQGDRPSKDSVENTMRLCEAQGIKRCLQLIDTALPKALKADNGS
jgi:hypothetical protein